MNRSYQLALVVAGLLVFAVLGYYLFLPGDTGRGSGQPPTPPGPTAQNPTPPPPPAPAPVAERPAPAADPAAMARIADSLRTTGSSAADTGIPTLTLGASTPGGPAPGDTVVPGAPTTMPAGSVGGAPPPSLAAYDAAKALGLDRTPAPGSPAPAPGSTTGTPGAGTPVMPLDPLSDPAHAAAAARALGASAVPVPGAAPGSAKTYTVKVGDSFSSIAKALYGSERHWVAISQANPMVDPNRLQVNQVLKLPEIAPEALRPRADAPTLTGPTTQPAINADGSSTYVVKPGDTLYTIAQRHYGKGEMWKAIYEANRAAIGANPERVKAGTKLVLPVGPVRAPRAAHPSPDGGEHTTIETNLDEQK